MVAYGSARPLSWPAPECLADSSGAVPFWQPGLARSGEQFKSPVPVRKRPTISGDIGSRLVVRTCFRVARIPPRATRFRETTR
jgi:hypothetical protein